MVQMDYFSQLKREKRLSIMTRSLFLVLKIFLVGILLLIALTFIFTFSQNKVNLSNEYNGSNGTFSSTGIDNFGFWGNIVFISHLLILLIVTWVICPSMMLIVIISLTLVFEHFDISLKESNSSYLYLSYLSVYLLIFFPIISVFSAFYLFPFVIKSFLHYLILSSEINDLISLFFGFFFDNNSSINKLLRLIFGLICLLLNLRLHSTVASREFTNDSFLLRTTFALILLLEPLALLIPMLSLFLTIDFSSVVIF